MFSKTKLKSADQKKAARLWAGARFSISDQYLLAWLPGQAMGWFQLKTPLELAAEAADAANEAKNARPSAMPMEYDGDGSNIWTSPRANEISDARLCKQLDISEVIQRGKFSLLKPGTVKVKADSSLYVGRIGDKFYPWKNLLMAKKLGAVNWSQTPSGILSFHNEDGSRLIGIISPVVDVKTKAPLCCTDVQEMQGINGIPLNLNIPQAMADTAQADVPAPKTVTTPPCSAKRTEAALKAWATRRRNAANQRRSASA